MVWPGWRGVPKGGFLNTMQSPRFSNLSRSSVAMVRHWAVQREQNKVQTHSTPLQQACKKKIRRHWRLGPRTTISQNSGGGGVTYKDRAWPAPRGLYLMCEKQSAVPGTQHCGWINGLTSGGTQQTGGMYEPRAHMCVDRRGQCSRTCRQDVHMHPFTHRP